MLINRAGQGTADITTSFKIVESGTTKYRPIQHVERHKTPLRPGFDSFEGSCRSSVELPKTLRLEVKTSWGIFGLGVWENFRSRTALVSGTFGLVKHWPAPLTKNPFKYFLLFFSVVSTFSITSLDGNQTDSNIGVKLN